MLEGQTTVPPELAELVAWIVKTVTPLAQSSGWSLTLNGAGDGWVTTDVRRVEHVSIPAGERRTETRDLHRFRLKTPPKPRG